MNHFFPVLVFIANLLAVLASKENSLDPDIQYGFMEYKDRCTSIGVGKKATVDGSTITTHNNDCQECDFRITHVPARDWPAGSKRPIFDIRVSYPRYFEPEGSDLAIHGSDYNPNLLDYSIYNWTAKTPFFYIDQVPHTYAYTLGTYGIQNEKQVSIGESTCSSVFFGVPVFAPNGKAVMHMETLTELALERCDSARCAIKLMGQLAEQYGFYGPEWDANIETAQDEAGEALTVSDADETWMFHILPDDTGASAIWVAQRVPDDHITVVANQFVISEINVEDSDNFLASSNIFDAAIRNQLWSPNSGKPFNFAVVYGTNRHETAFACTRRVWRVLTLAAPSLLPMFSGYTDGLQSFGFGADGKSPYPFSVKPDRLLSPQDIMKMNRDQFENSDFDMSANLDGGVFGDTMRFPPMSKIRDPVNGISWTEYVKGLGFQRPISLWRTAYSTVTQSRKSLPDIIGGVTWIAQYAPHHSSFVPVYAQASHTPSSLKAGTQYKMDKASNWWIHCLTGNYLSRFYKYTIGDVISFQTEIESFLSTSQSDAEKEALSLYSQISNVTSSESKQAILHKIDKLLTKFQESMSVSVRDKWWDFFFKMAGKYRDMYMIVNEHAESFSLAFKYLTVPRSWFESVGFWGRPGTPPPDSAPVPIKPINVPSLNSPEEYAANYPLGFTASYDQLEAMAEVPSLSPTNSPVNPTDPPSAIENPTQTSTVSSSGYGWLSLLIVFALGLLFGVLGVIAYNKYYYPNRYLPLH